MHCINYKSAVFSGIMVGNEQIVLSFPDIDNYWTPHSEKSSNFVPLARRTGIQLEFRQQGSPAVVREDALQLIQLLLQYWPSRSSKIDDFYLIRKGEIWLVVRWKNAHFPTPVHWKPNLKMFPLHCIPKILYAESTDTELIICARCFPLWPNAYSQYIRQRQMIDRWHATVP